MSRSSGRSDVSTRDSQQSIPKSFGQESRANTMPLQRTSGPAPPTRINTSGNMDRNWTGTLHPVSPPTSRDGEQFTSREKANEDQIETEEESRDQTSWFLTATPIAEKELFYYDERPKPPVPSLPTKQQEFLSASAHPEPGGERNSSEIGFYDASETPGEPAENNDWVMVSPPQEQTDLPPQELKDASAHSGPETSHIPPSSVLNRPRGSTIEEFSPPLPTSPTAASPPEVEPTAAQSVPIKAEPPEQGSSSLLPPIRCTSTFGVGVGPRQKKPRFPIEDDEEEASISSLDKSGSEHLGSEVAAVATATTARGIAARDVGRPRPDSETWPSEESVRVLPHPVAVPHPGSQPNLPNETREHPYQQEPATQAGPIRLEPLQTGSLEYHQGTTIYGEPEQHREQLSTPPAPQVPMGSNNLRSFEDSWRPNAATSSQPPPTQWTESTVAPSRNSWEPQRNRGMSGSNQNLTRPNGSYTERPPLAGDPSQIKSFEQPPSSAQRYPDLFRPVNPLPVAPGMHADPVLHAGASDLPSHYYQQPIPREAAFLPRQNTTNEYQLPGVGPPVDEPGSAKSRRNSGFFRELGGRISRGTSRERGGSISREDGFSPPRNFDSHENDYAESSIGSEEGKEKKKKKQRSNFLGHLTRASTSELSPPKTRESMVTHPSGSRIDLLASKQSKEQKRPHFDNSPVAPKAQPERASTSLGMNEEPGKKKRFSGLTGFFGHPGNSPSRASMPVQARSKPQDIRKVSYGGQQSIERGLSDPRKATSPPGNNPQPQTDYNYPPSNYRPPTSPNYPTRPNNYQPLASDDYQPPSPKRVPPATNTRAPSQTRNIFSVLANNTASSSHDSRKENKDKTRRPSAAGLFNGFMGRKSQQSERDRDESRSQGSQSQSQSQSGRQPLPRAQTYTDLQEREQEMEPRMQWLEQPTPQPAPQKSSSSKRQDPSYQDRDRGRRISREPQYDSVPIPGGYSLVRGQGAMTVPTEYDPRGINRAPQPDPRYGQQQNWGPGQYPSPPAQVQPQQYNNGQQYQSPPPQQYSGSQYQIPSPQQSIPSPNNGQEPRHQPPSLGAVESYDPSMSHRLSHDLSLSPTRHPEGQRALNDPNRRLSRDLAFSPARVPEGQQPPYQLSLPGDASSEDERPPPIEKDPIIVTPLSSPPKHNSIQRLQQPIIQHPGSPAGYLVPDSTFSPVNPAATDLPPPPLPKSPTHLDTQYRPGHGHMLSADDSLNLSLDLNRSNTRRTAVSAVSVMSSPGLPPDSAGLGAGRSDSLTVPNMGEQKEGVTKSPSPSPPTPDAYERGRKDERGTSREKGTGGADTTKKTVLEHNPPVLDNDDIYDASPRLPNIASASTSRFNTSNPTSPVSPTGAGPSKVGNAKGKENDHTAELDNTDQKRYRAAREEKIVYDGGVSEETEPTATMSATSYPGQEWNPYAGVGFEDGYE
jgi:hypothetical protein